MGLNNMSSLLPSTLNVSADGLKYIPLILEDTHTVRLRIGTYFAFMALLFYDHAITFGIEVQTVWKAKWRLPQYLFFINRYIAPSMLTFNAIVFSTPDLSEPFCDFFARWQTFPYLISLATVELLVVLRVSAIFWNNSILNRFLAFIFICEITVLVAILVVVANSSVQVVPTFGILPGCIAFVSTYPMLYGLCLGPLVFESVIIILTAYRAIELMRGGSVRDSMLKLLVRDSMIYFIIMFAILLANVIVLKVLTTSPLGSLLMGPSNVIACMAVGRMMLNMCALPLGESTQSNCGMSVKLTFRRPVHAEESEGGINGSLQ